MKQVIGFTAGAMDLLHAGHVMMLQECKAQCDYLIVAVEVDPSVDRPEKHKPIESLEERVIRLQGCKYVDKVVIYNTEQGLYSLLKEIQPDVRFIGADWKDKPNYSRDLLPGMKVVYNSRNHNFSSSNLIARIKNA
jgi:glycerol-3-phosphate cytidylyltransferase